MAREYLKKLRKVAGLNQTEVADRLGMTQANVAQIENGRNKVLGLSTITALAEIYECDVQLIINEELKYGTGQC